jgi:DNA-binding transcriptional regulator GbsR (MarR family)
MKIFALVLLCATAYLNNAADPPKPEDYREKYDQLLMELINERIREGERFLEKLSAELKEYQTSKKEADRAHIESEVQFILPLLKNVQHYFETELKKPNLDTLEKYSVEKARDDAVILTEALTEIEKAVAKTAAPVTTASVAFFADTPAPVDYRSEYDRLLFQTIEERIQRGDGMLLGLQRQLVEYQKSKSTEVRDNIVREVDGILPLLKMAEDHATNELKRTDLDYIERFLYEKAKDQVALLIKHYTMIETAVKGTATATTVASFEFFAATPAPAVDWRSEYDRLLFEFTENNIRRADELLVRLQRQVNEYKKTNDKTIADRVAREVDFTIPFVKDAIEHAQSQLKRTDLNEIEKYLFEKVNDEATILIKYYTALEKEVKTTFSIVSIEVY